MLNIAAGAPASTGYNLTRSLRFRASATAYLNRTNTSTVTNNKIWTWSAWVKRGTLSNGVLFGFVDASTLYQDVILFASDKIRYVQYVAGALTAEINTVQVFRDPSAWYHIVVAVDTTQATSTNRFKLYVNGVQVTSFSPATYVAQNEVGYINKASQAQGIGVWYPYNTNNFYDGYLADVNFIDGQALTPSSFGETNTITGVWQPKAYTGTYGTNGFYLPFTDNSTAAALGTDFSGNSNTWTVNNISVTAGVTYDSMTDVPTLTNATAANFCTLNPLNNYQCLTANANLQLAYNGSVQGNILGTIGVTSGKYYWETTVTALSSSIIGVYRADSPITTAFGANAYGYVYTGVKISNSTTAAYGAAFTTNDVIGTSFDADNGTITFYKNNVSQGVAYTGLTGGFFFPAFDTNNATLVANFGQRPFAYTPPTGFIALNTFNLPTSTILKGNTVMDATTYTGTGAALSVTNAAGFKPDLVWLKSRSNATDNELTDSVRGVTKSLISNSTAVEATDTQGLTAFNSNGFTLGTDANYNGSTRTFVGWQWQAGQGSSSSNTSGTITSTVSVNAAAGFSVVTYTANGTTGSTFGHGLGVAPAFVILKSRNVGATDWFVYHQSLGGTKGMYLNLANAAATSSAFWNNTAPSSTVVTVGSSSSINTTGSTNVAYCFAEIAGFSKFGNYTGNGSADGTFVYTGFRPKAVIIVNSSAAENWRILDTSRNSSNVVNAELYPSLSNAEATNTVIDILSNGFKIRTTSSAYNTSGNSYIYAAWAENPFKNSLAR